MAETQVFPKVSKWSLATLRCLSNVAFADAFALIGKEMYTIPFHLQSHFEHNLMKYYVGVHSHAMQRHSIRVYLSVPQ